MKRSPTPLDEDMAGNKFVPTETTYGSPSPSATLDERLRQFYVHIAAGGQTTVRLQDGNGFSESEASAALQYFWKSMKETYSADITQPYGYLWMDGTQQRFTLLFPEGYLPHNVIPVYRAPVSETEALTCTDAREQQMGCYRAVKAENEVARWKQIYADACAQVIALGIPAFGTLGQGIEKLASTRSATRENDWIACADRHPGNYQTVLLTDGDGIRSTGFWNGSRWSVDVCEGTSDPYLTPTHWMPLPAAPNLDLMATLKHEIKKREEVK